MQYVASISYGKDSLAMLHVIKDVLHKPLDRIITAEVWATDAIQADLPPMVEFKDKADQIIFERWGVKVEHFYAKEKDGTKRTYEKVFYRKYQNPRVEKRKGQIYGFPIIFGPWCNNLLKKEALDRTKISGSTSYIGIASDEQKRIQKHENKPGFEMPLVEAGWTEAICRKWCEDNGMLSPLYNTTNRGGCWFCHNQTLDQLRHLRKEYPELWAILMGWDTNSPESFHPDGRTVHDLDKRFQLEEEGYFNYSKFGWDSLKAAQMNIDQFL